MTPKSFLNYMGRARGMASDRLRERITYVAEKCSLRGVWSKPIGKLSKGYRQRVGMAHALLHDPEVLILDEPTSGLDPNQTHEARELIRSLAGQKTVLLSTHILTEVKAVCNRVLLVHDGRLVLDGPVDRMEDDTHSMEQRFRELTTA
jgi:ABC-2 type transport system ATP-binding protein